MRLLREGKTVKILTVGRKGADNLRRDLNRNIVERIDFRGIKQMRYVRGRAGRRSRIMEMFEAGEFDVCTLYFSEFKSVIAQKPTALQLIPAKIPEAKAERRRQGRSSRRVRAVRGGDPRRPARRATSRTQIFRGLLENAASEQGARMSAMDNATRNAGDMINKLTIKYNRQRQANITKELIEIISGAEAL